MQSAFNRLLRPLSFLSLLLVLIGASTCGFWDVPSTEPEITVAVNVAGLTPDITSLTVTDALNGTMSQHSQEVTTRLDRFAIALPLSTTGSLTVNVAAHSSDHCLAATGQVVVDIKTAPPTRYEVTLTLTPTEAGAGKLCQLKVQVFGKGTVTSVPAGISCVGQALLTGPTECSADFAVGTQIALNETHDARVYGVAWDGLCTTAPCSVLFNASGTVRTGFGGRTCSKDSWCFHNPLPQGNNVNAIWGASSSDIWAVGDNGLLLHYDGMVWSASGNVGDLTTANLYGVFGTSSTDVWAAGDSGTLLHFDGKAWAASPQSTIVSTQTLRGLWASAPNDYWAVGLNAAILHFDGSNWSVAAAPTGVTAPLYSVWGSGASDVFAVGANGVVIHYKVTSPATTPAWVSEASNTTVTLYSVSGSGPNKVWAVGWRILGTYVSGATRYDGTTWTADTGGNFGLRRATSVWVTPSGKAWASGYGNTGLAAATYNDGTSWNVTDFKTLTYTSPSVNSSFGFGESDIWAVGTNGIMFHYDGQTWTPARLAAGYNTQGLESVWGTGPNEVWAVGYNGTIRHFDGNAWSESSASGVVTTAPLYQVWGATPNFVLAAGGYASTGPSTVLRYDGANWAVVPWSGTSTTQYLYGISGPANATSAQIVGGYGTLASYNGTNITLSNQSYPIASSTTTPPQLTTSYLNAAWGNSTSVYAVGDGGTILYGSTNFWSAQTGSGTVTTNSLQSIWGTATNNMWAVGYNGTILHFNGSAWAVDAASTNGTTTTSDYLYSVWVSPQIGWIVGSPGTILRLNGTTWSRVNSGTKNYLSGVWASSLTDAWAVGSNGLTLRYQP